VKQSGFSIGCVASEASMALGGFGVGQSAAFGDFIDPWIV